MLQDNKEPDLDALNRELAKAFDEIGKAFVKFGEEIVEVFQSESFQEMVKEVIQNEAVWDHLRLPHEVTQDSKRFRVNYDQDGKFYEEISDDEGR